MADTFINPETAGDTLGCSHPRGRRFDAVTFTIGGHPAGESHRLCADCGWDFGPTDALNNLGRIAGELWQATLGAEHVHNPEQYVQRRAERVLARWGVTAAWFDAEVDARLSPKAAYYASPCARTLVDPWGVAA